MKIASFVGLTKYSYLLFYFKNIVDFASKAKGFIGSNPNFRSRIISAATYVEKEKANVNEINNKLTFSFLDRLKIG